VDALRTFIWIALALAGAGTLAHFVVALRRLWLSLRVTPRLDGYTDRDAAGLGRVCVIVPAHNEARVIERVALALVAQDHPALRIVFALDRCTDETRAILERAVAGDGRVEIIEIDECPEGWAGKTNALRVAAEESAAARDADLLLFLDADTEPAPSCVRAAAALLEEGGHDLVSLLGRLSFRRWFERVVQPMTSLELMRQNPLSRVNRPRDRTSFANGQFMLFRRSAYEALGGHGRVKDELLEDLAFARALKADGRSWVVALAGPMLLVRMYGSWPAFCAGWKRIFIESVNRRPDRLRAYARRVRLAYAVAPALSLIGVVAASAALARGAGGAGPVVALAACAGGLGAWLLFLLGTLGAQGAPAVSLLASPAGAWLTGRILRGAAEDLERNRGVRWGGRLYTDLAPRTPARLARDATAATVTDA